MRRLIAVLIGLGLATALRAEDAVDWRDAAQCTGRTCSVRGTVVEALDDGPVIRLYFDADRRDVYVTLVRGLLVTWPSYAGEQIVATGRVDRFRGATEIIVKAPGDVVVVDPATPSAAAPAAPGPATPAPGELERLRQRVRELEERLDEGAPAPR